MSDDKKKIPREAAIPKEAYVRIQNIDMSKESREKAEENGLRSGKGRQWLSRLLNWVKRE